MSYTRTDKYQKLAFLFALTLFSLFGCSNINENPTDDVKIIDPRITLTSHQCEDMNLYCEYELIAPEDAIYVQIIVEQYVAGKHECLLVGGMSIGEEKKPVNRIIGSLKVETTSKKPLSIVISCSKAGSAEYTILSEIFDDSFTTSIESKPITPIINQPVELIRLQSNNNISLLIKVVFGDKNEAFESIDNSTALQNEE